MAIVQIRAAGTVPANWAPSRRRSSSDGTGPHVNSPPRQLTSASAHFVVETNERIRSQASAQASACSPNERSKNECGAFS